MADLFGLVAPALRALPPEAAHRLTIWGLAHGLGPAEAAADDPVLATRVWDLDVPNPIGIAAGFDKAAEVPDAMLKCGFGFAEVGSITPLPQPGNPRPRVFRLPEDAAVINRLGFNSGGLAAAAANLARRPRRGVVGVNLGKNRDAADAAADYARGAREFAPLADYLVVNVSSPNTPGLRALQSRGALAEVLAAVRGAIPADGPPLLLKIAPDLGPEDRADIAALAGDGEVDGLIVGNTTVSRPDGLRARHRTESGGLSGRPLFALATEILADMARRTERRVPLIGVGGVASGADAYAKIRAGASLVQLYTALIYRGPALVGRIKRDLAALLRRDGFAAVGEAVGAGL